MSSERRIRASRANGAKSPGPKTPESKAHSAANSLRHGMLARVVVLDDENPQVFTELIGVFERDLAPQNEIERALVENMAIARWRLFRLLAIEKSTMKIEMDKHIPATPEPCTRAALAFRGLSDGSRTLDLLNRYDARFDRQFARALTLLLKLRQPNVRQDSRPVDSEPVPPPENAFCQTNLVPEPDTCIPEAPG